MSKAVFTRSDGAVDQPRIREGLAGKASGQSGVGRLMPASGLGDVPLLCSTAGGFLVGLAPLLGAHGRRLLDRPEYHYVPFVLICVALLLGARWSQAGPSSSTRSIAPIWPEVTLLCTASAMQVLAVALRSSFVSACTALTLAGCAFLVLKRWRSMPGVWGIWGLLWLCVPIPLGFDQDISRRLQAVSSRCSEYLLDLIGVNHLMSGNVLLLPDHQLFVDEACGGVVSVMSVVACSAVFSVWSRCRLGYAVALMLVSVVWAVLLNVARIVLIALALQRYGVDFSTGAAHTLLGMGCLAGCCLLIISTHGWLLLLFSPIELPAEIADDEVAWNPLIRRWSSRLRPCQENAIPAGPVQPAEQAFFGVGCPSRRLAKLRTTMIGSSALFAVLGGWQAAAQGGAGWRRPNPTDLDVARHVALAESLHYELLPESVDHWRRLRVETKRREKGSGFGEFSKIFHYEGERGLHAMVSLDYPFTSHWHELTICYRSIGWNLMQRRRTSGETQTGKSWDYVEAGFGRRSGERGILFFALLDSQGEVVAPPRGGLAERIAGRVLRDHRDGVFFQVQIWLTAQHEIDELDREAVRKLFLACRAVIRAQLLSQQI